MLIETRAFELRPDGSRVEIPVESYLPEIPKRSRDEFHGKARRLYDEAVKAGVINPIPVYFRDNPPPYWILSGDNIDTTDIGFFYEEALANLQKGAGLAGQPLEFFEPNH